MKKNNVEKQFVEKLAAREIVPSGDSWDRLDAMLTVAEKPKRNLKRLYIAASVLGFLLVGSLFFNTTNETFLSKDNQLVIEEALDNPKKSVKSSQENQQEKNVNVSSSSPIVVVEKRDLKKANSNNTPTIIEENDIVRTDSTVSTALEPSIANQKMQVQIVPKKASYVNVDELLASVDPMHKKTTSKVFASNVKVNSQELLSEVDGELELSFREKALQMVSKNVKTAAVTLSNRNSQ